ncbi:MAG: hypothetical protein J6X01_02715 [Bacteroidales bacterium]|nr:hypothetical protein [Bacteroidales bacterium]
MKKFALSLFAIAISTCMMAQSVILSEPYSNIWIRRVGIQNIPLGQDDSNLYYFVQNRQSDPVKPKSYIDHLYIVDKNEMQKSDIEVSVTNNKYLLVDALHNDNSIVALYRGTNNKGDQIYFSIANIDKTEKTYKFDGGNNSVSTTANSHYWPEYKTAKSPDGNMLAVLTMVTGKNSKLENLFAVVMNNQGEFVWSGTVVPDFHGRTFSLGNLLVDNEGTIFIPAYTCQVSGNSVSNVEFMMIQANDGDTKAFTSDCSFGALQNMTSKILSDKNIAVAGYYTNTFQNTAAESSGFFFYTFDTGSESITDVHNFDFSGDYVEKKAWARFASVLGNQQYSISADNIFELENGSLVLCGEHRFVKQIYDPNMNSYTYQMLTKNILVSTLQSNGNANFTMIEKQQSAALAWLPQDWKLANISYSAFAHHNNVYFLYTENPKNIPYPGKDEICNIYGLNFKKKWESVLMKLTPDQEISQRVLYDPNQLLRSVEFSDDEYFYASGTGKKEIFLTKYKIEE